MKPEPSKDILLMFTVVTSVSSTVAVLLNSFLILVIARNKSLQQVENTFLVNLAVGDILLGLIGYFCIVIWNESHRDESACICFVAVCAYTAGVTLLFISLMTLEKYVRILHPFHYTRLCTKKNVLLITIFIHASCAGMIGLSILLYQGNNHTLCSFYTEFSNNTLIVVTSLFVVIILFLAVTNTRILFVSWRKQNEVQDLKGVYTPRSGFRGVKVLAVLTMFMFVFYLPMCILIILKVNYVLSEISLDNLAIWAATIWLLTPMADGIAFLFCRQDIRKCALKLIRNTCISIRNIRV